MTTRSNERWLTIAIIILSIFGMFMIGSASINEDSKRNGMNALLNVIKHAGFCVTGLMFMNALRRWFTMRAVNKKTLKVAYVVILGAMLVCLFWEINGAHNWIPLGIFTIQPSEFAKPVVILLLAYALERAPRRLAPRRRGYMTREQKNELLQTEWIEYAIKPVGLCVILFAVCLLLQRDLGTSIIIALIAFTCFFVANHPGLRQVQHQAFGLVLIGIVLLVVATPILGHVLKPYQLARITNWLHPLQDVYDTGYQQINGLIAFAKNGLFGAGFGNSTQKFGYIPEAYNDFITSIAFEELGIFSLVFIIIPYVMIIHTCFEYATLTKNSQQRIVLSGIAMLFFAHLFMNLGGVSGLIPMTGVPLLCVSMGGSSTWVAYICIGIAQSMIRDIRREEASHV